MAVRPAGRASVEPLPRPMVGASVVGPETTAQAPGRPTLPTMPPLLHAPNPIGQRARTAEPRATTRNIAIVFELPGPPAFPPWRLRRLTFVEQHPGRAELVPEHRKARGEKRLLHLHEDLTAIRKERVEAFRFLSAVDG